MSREKKMTWMLATVALLMAWTLFLPGLIKAGDIEPPPGAVDASGNPVSTMHTLDEIYNKLDQLTGKGAAYVPQTGQTSSYATGDDGDWEKGVPWPNPRFTDNGNETVTDNLTGLIWLKSGNCFGKRTWAQALADCNNLAHGSCGLTDGSSAGDWRLPNIKELQSLIDYGRWNPALPAGHPFMVKVDDYYWSSTTYASSTDYAWYMDFYDGTDNYYYKLNYNYVRAVRGGQ